MFNYIKNILNYLTTGINISKKSYLSYTIKGNRHFSSGEGIIPYMSFEKELNFNIKFNKNANAFIPQNPRQINKAIGLKEGIIPNKNSVILGFSTYDNNFELWLFVNHNDKSFESIKIGNFKTEEWITGLMLGISKEKYYLKRLLDDGTEIVYVIPRKNISDVPKVLGIVNPYFGGKEKNPMGNSIKIQIQIS